VTQGYRQLLAVKEGAFPVTRWLSRTLIVLCCLELSAVQDPLQGQQILGTPTSLPDVAPSGAAVVCQQPVPVEPSGHGARLGAPEALPDTLAAHDGEVPVQYVPPLTKREGMEDAADSGLLLPPTLQLTLPGPQRLFRLDSEAAVMERIRQEAREQRTPTIIEFPEPYASEKRVAAREPRQWPQMVELVQPCYVYHGRLTFEQINSERYGWSLGVIQPLVSGAHFYADVAMLPYHMAEDPCRYGDTSAGKCLPGDPVPLYLYPPHWSLTGLVAEAAVVTTLFFVFP
jgi:hypothetical protein